MHVLFAELLKVMRSTDCIFSPLKEQFLHICEALNDSSKEDRLNMQQSLSTLNAWVSISNLFVVDLLKITDFTRNFISINTL